MTIQPFVNPYNVVTPLTPDMDAIFSQLQVALTNDGAVDRIWTDAITVATGSYIARMVSSFTADLSFTVERVQHEWALRTARRPSSIYAIADMLGVHITRKLPGGLSVRLARSSAAGQPAVLSIPAYTQCNIGGKAYFNRSPIVFAAGIVYLTVTLYRGTVQQVAGTSSGAANQSFVLAQPNFYVSDVDIFVTDATGMQWTRVVDGLWQYISSRVFQDTTQTDGSVRLDFGDGIYGSILPAGTFYVNYVLVQTSEYDASLDLNTVALSTPVVITGFTNVAGLTIGEESSIQPEYPVTFYQNNAPHISSGVKHANTRDNYRGLALTYPGVIDARMLGQAEINPQDLRWMTGIACCLLTTTTWAAPDWSLFVAFMQRNSDSARHFYRYDPSPVTVNFNVYGELQVRADLPTQTTNLTTLLGNMFTLEQGSLGAKYSKMLIGKQLVDSATDPYGPLVTYLRIDDPVDDIVLRPNQYALPGTINVNLIASPQGVPRIVSGVSVPGGSIGISG